jgi:hypothetical protein
MSDIFSQFGNHYESQRDRQAQQYQEQLGRTGRNYAAERDEQHAARLEDVRQRHERAQRLREQYGFDYTVTQYAALAGAIDNGIIGEDQAYDILAAQTISDNLKRQGINIDPVEIYENLPAYSEYVLGRSEGQSARTPKTNLAAIHGAFVVAGANMRKNFLGMQLADARRNNNTELENIILERLQLENKTTEEYSDYQKRNFLVEAAKYAAQSVPYTAFVMAGGLLGGAPGAFAAGWAGATGQAYLGLDAAGVDHKIAYPISIAMGAVNALIESQLGNAAGLIGRATGANTLQSAISRRAAAFVSDKLHLSGAALKMATGPVARYILESAGEMSEEVFQEIGDIVFTELAAFLQGEGVELGRENYIRRIAEAAKGGFMASLIMGIPGLAIDTVGSTGDYRALRTDADTIPSEQLFKERHKDSPLRGDMTDKEWDKELSKIHNGRQSIREREESRVAEELRNRRLYGAMDKSGDIYRGEGGSLYMEHSRHRESGGLVTFEFAAGNPHGGEQNSYAVGRGEMRGDVPAITELRIGEKYEGLRDEILQNAANDIGKPFEYEGRQYAPNGEGRSLRYGWDTEQAAQNAARGFNFNRAYYNAPDTQADTSAKQNFTERLKSLDTRLEGDAAAQTVVGFYDHLGRKLGMGFDAFINRMTGGKPDSLLTQKLSDAEVARWVANNEGLAADAAAVRRIQENLTDAQRDEARQNIHGFIVPGADGVTKAIYAARDADVSTFIHEGVHAFTQLAKALDPALYRQMMEAAGFSQEEYSRTDAAGRERMARQAMETLAYGAEAYLKEGPKSARNSALKDLYERIKEFLKDLADAAQKAEYLTPEVRALFDELFGGQAEGAQEAAVTQQEANTDAPAETPADELEIYSDSFDRIIKDDSRPVDERAKAVVRKAEREYTDELLDERDRGHRPTMELIKLAGRITDAAERAKVTAEIRELRKRYAGTAAEFKAPNGKASRLIDALGKELGQQAWYAVRAEGFKKWFGDWERAARIAEAENLIPKKITAGETRSKKDLEKLAQTFKAIKNNIDGRVAEIPINTIGKIYGHQGYDISRIVEHIPALYETSILGWSEPEQKREGHKFRPNIKENHHYVNKFTDGTGEYFIRFTLSEGKAKPGKTGKSSIHSTAISNITVYKNGDGSQRIRVMYPGEANSSPFHDSRLADFFNSVKPDSVSKIVDENGEPLVVYHRTNSEFSTFDKKLLGTASHWNTAEFGFYFSNRNENEIESYGKKAMPVFLNIKNPYQINVKYYSDFDYDYKHFDPKNFENNDGIIISAEKQQFSYESDKFFVAFDPNQIKSATGNAGTFGADEGNIYFQAAFHGSPHRFNRFDSSHMGEGEGAQVYGWGHYFASKKEVAEWYYKNLSMTSLELYELGPLAEMRVMSLAKDSGLLGHIVDYEEEKYKASYDDTEEIDPAIARVLSVLDQVPQRQYKDGELEEERINSLGIIDVIKYIEETGETPDIDGLFKTISGFVGSDEKALKLFKKNDLAYKPGQLYEVDIPGDEEMLDWDEKLLESPSYDDSWPYKLEVVREKGRQAGLFLDGINLGLTGEEIYAHIRQNFVEEKELSYDEAQKQASLLLNDAGFKGIRYLDGGSRAKGEGSHNYVIFDDSSINITQTYYSESFREAGLSEFMNNYPEVVKEAARFDSGAEMAEHYADYLPMPDEVYKKAQALGYFDALARAAKAGNAENATNAISGVSAKKAAAALAVYGANAKQAYDAAGFVRRGDWQAAVELLEKHGVPRIDAETYADTAKIFSRPEMLWLKKQADTANDAPAKNQKQPGAETVKLGRENAAVLKFFGTLVDGAKEIYPDEDIEAQRAELAGEPRTAKAFVDMIYTDKGFDDLIKTAYEVIRDGPQRGMDEAETRRNEYLFYRTRAAFNAEGNWNWKTAFAAEAVNRKVDARTKKILQGMIRNRPLQYMEAWAMMTGDDTWLPEENDVRRIKRLDTEGLADEEYLEKQSPEELERIGRRLSSDRVKKKIDDKTLLLDDPDLNDYEKQLKEDLARAKALIAEREEGFKKYQTMLDKTERNARKEQMLLEQGAADTSDEGLKKSRERTKKTAEAHKKVRETVAEMERFMREDLTPTQRAAFVELRRQLKERERIHAELKAIAEIREIKKRNLRQILRKPDLNTVSVNEAKLIEWVQAHFDSYQAVARFIGRGAKDIRQLYNDFATSAEYRGTLKKKLPDAAYHQIERIVFKDLAGHEVRAYGEIDARQRRVLYKHLLDHQGIFEELGIDILAEPRQFSGAEWAAVREEMKDRIPADVLYKLEGLITKDKNRNRRFRVENFKDSDLQTLAGVVNKLRKEGREREAARRDARKQLWQEGQEKILETLKAHMPKNAAGSRMEGIAETRQAEGKRSGWRDVWFGLHNTRRFFRKLEGGVDGYLYDYITQREYSAFDEENRRVFERREKVDQELEKAKIDIKDLGRHKFMLWNGQEASLEEMMTFYYAQYNERALHAVMFGNFAAQEERKAIEQAAKDMDIEGQLNLEAKIAGRYWSDIKKLDEFFAQGENAKYRQVMDIIGRDFDENYSRLKEFAAREFNAELGSEPYYMPLNRVSVTAEEGKDFENAMADAGHAPYINDGFLKGRVDIPSWGQSAIQAGFYTTWDRMVVKQEHLMAYGSLHREMKQIFQGQGSEALRETLKRGYSEAAVKKVKNFISELAAPPVQEDLAAMNAINRVIRGHYPAAVLGWRIASIVKQAVESPPPFLQYVNPIEYGAALVACSRKENRDMIYKKSIYMKARYFDPSAAVVHEMEKLYMTGKLGKAEAALAFVEKKGMWFQEWIDSVCVMPGWLAAYNRKLAELNKSGDNMTMEAAEASAVRYADGVVRDCQPSSVLMDQIAMLKGSKHPFVRMFMQFQTPIASIFQQLFIDAPNNFKQGRILQALWTWGIYALLAMVIGAMHEDDDDDEWLKKRGIDALVMPLEMVPIFGGDMAYAAETLLRNGKIRTPRRSNFPVVDQGVRAVNAITDEKWGKAAWSVVKGFGFYTGLPVAAMQDIEKAIEDEKWYRAIGIK